METLETYYNENQVLCHLKRFLPAQAPLKDFVFHNTLQGFQNLKFHNALHKASKLFGYKVYLTIKEYRDLYNSRRIGKGVLEKIIVERKGEKNSMAWMEKILFKEYDTAHNSRIGLIRSNWKNEYHIDLDLIVQPILFRILCSYLDQGISIWNFPVSHKGFLDSIREMERNSYTSFFKSDRVKKLLLNSDCGITNLLDIIVGDKSFYEQYLFDQQFAHQGWSGMVSKIEDQPQSLLDNKKISLQDLIIFELLLEIDALDSKFGKVWAPLASRIANKPIDLFAEIPVTELDEVYAIWQEAFEWSHYDQVLAGIKTEKPKLGYKYDKTFQALFCIDDREISFRHYVEDLDNDCETFGTPGFFNVEFYFQPINGKFYSKQCPAPLTPKYLIKEVEAKSAVKNNIHLSKNTHGLVGGWLHSQTVGFLSAANLFLNVFKPSVNSTSVSSVKHMDKLSQLIIENKDKENKENDLQVGFDLEEMAQRVEGLLKSIGLVKDFAPIIYVIGHGSSSANNPYYATMDCGACSCRPGSVNARVVSHMANHPKVREILSSKGLDIPQETQFIGALHDTTRDDIIFFDENVLSPKNVIMHQVNQLTFKNALDFNAKERSRRFESINTKLSPEKIHDKVRTRSVSIFEPRPELDHATNSLCIIGRRSLTKDLFLDRRAFLNSYNYKIDPDGKYLLNIMKAAAPVCGGINLGYYFSTVDNQKLGAGTKLPHNVMGLFGIANGIEGDLRPGLPKQMIEVHDPVRLLMIVEHFPDVVLKTIKINPETYEWFINEWIHLIVINPEVEGFHYFKSEGFHHFKDGNFYDYQPLEKVIKKAVDIMPLFESTKENIPVLVF
jgi:uncharacterized protein YbcC (UPF0753/DUF2309 family)